MYAERSPPRMVRATALDHPGFPERAQFGLSDAQQIPEYRLRVLPEHRRGLVTIDRRPGKSDRIGDKVKDS